eukprot:171420-Hanusia_phi.AAC.1
MFQPGMDTGISRLELLNVDGTDGSDRTVAAFLTLGVSGSESGPRLRRSLGVRLQVSQAPRHVSRGWIRVTPGPHELQVESLSEVQ